MDKATLMAISPLDGRYQDKMSSLPAIFSEYGLMKFRLLVEIRWLETLTDVATLEGVEKLTTDEKDQLHHLIENFSIEDALQIKEIEGKTNHDVKAVEYFIKKKLATSETLSNLVEYIHFGCTSEDINNLAYSLMCQSARQQCLLPALDKVLSLLRPFAHKNASVAMLSRTHGQPATPTTVGKEIANVVSRLERQKEQLSKLTLLGKMNGASGNYNALHIAYPNVHWQEVCQRFVQSLGLSFNAYTTQIEPHDSLSEFFSAIIRINTILIDFDRDIWGYISLNYFKQKAHPQEVGSSTMPHKINPIDFENSEGNLGIANALFEHMILKLPISRWQRDLSDSTVLRNVGVAIGHSILAYQATGKGLNKLEPNLSVIAADLDNHWEILAEAVQTMMRRYHLPEPYEQLKTFTRGKEMNQLLLHEFIQGLAIPDQAKNILLTLTPNNYLGYATELAEKI